MTAYDTIEALADPTRRTVFETVCQAPRSVGEISARLPVTRPAVSQHLRVLADAGLVRYTRDGTRHVYRADPEGLAPLRRYVEELWDDVLEAFAGAEAIGPAKGAKR